MQTNRMKTSKQRLFLLIQLACVAGVSKNLREGNETERECEKKTYVKETKLGGSAKNMEGVTRAKETPAMNPRHFIERPQTWGRQLSHENQ